MKRFKKILFINNENSKRTAALQRAVHLASANKAALTVVEALEEFPADIQMAMAASDMADYQKVLTDESSRRIETLIAPIQKEGVKASGKVLWGSPWLEIIREVLRGKHDLVMVVPRKKAKLEEVLFGSRTMHLMRKCPCPVWAVKSTQRKPYAKIMAAVDVVPSDDEKNLLNNKIMELAASLAGSEKGQLHVVHCWQPFYERTLRWRSGLSQAQVGRMIDETRKNHKAWVNELSDKFRAKDLNLKTHLLEGEPDERIAEMVTKRRIGLVVMGTVVRTGLSGFLIGNTAEKVLHKLNCSVLAVKPDGFETPVSVD